MTARVTIRRAMAADFAAIRDLQDALDAEHAQSMPALFRPLDEPRFTRADVMEWIESATCCLLVAEDRGALFGFIDASIDLPTEPDDIPEPWCGVHNLTVAPAYRRSGIGTALMRAAEAWARTHGLLQIRLEVFEFNVGARALYEQLGYGTVSRQMLKPLDIATGDGRANVVR